ncbi:MAG: transposase, partial [Nitrososphaeraceae archaeon]
RWIVESVFSSIKRMFGEYVSARRFPNMVKEMMLKASLYNMFIVYHNEIANNSYTLG